MEISCNIIRDLLPLYAEDMVSQDSKVLVDNHLCGCDACTKELAELLKRPPVPVDAEPASLKRVGKTIRRQRVLTVLAMLMTIANILVTGATMSTAEIWLPCEEAIEDVYLDEHGDLIIDYARCVSGIGDIRDENNFFLSCNTSLYAYARAKLLDRKISEMTQEEIKAYIKSIYRDMNDSADYPVEESEWNRFFGIKKMLNLYVDENGDKIITTQKGTKQNLIYVNRDGTDGTVLWDSGKPVNWTAMEAHGGYLWEEVFWFCVVFSVGLAVLLRKKRSFRMREMVVRMTIVLGSAAFGLLVVSFGQFNYSGERLSYGWFYNGSLIAVATTLTALLWRQLYLLNRKDYK